ncbi:MAG: hypothetical protein RLY89_983 [Bacteroidota bacterium]
MKNQVFQIRGIVLIILCLNLCCEPNYDVPPSGLAQAFAADLTIKDLKSKHVMGKFEQWQKPNTIVGVIVANDRTDNFYKSIVVQDSTGGITIRLDGIKLSANYPVGMQIAIQLKGLWLGDYGKLIQLGAGVDLSDPAYPSLFPIPQTLFDQYLIKGPVASEPEAQLVKITELGNNYQSRLILLSQVAFVVADTGKTYADAKNKESLNRTIQDCYGNNIILRTSGYASFAQLQTPAAMGSVKGIYSVFGTTKQLVIRDTGDIHMRLPRCK